MNMLCVLFCRYNISTQDYEAWGGEVTSANNTRMRRTNLDVFTQFGFNATQAEQVNFLKFPVTNVLIYCYILAGLLV